MQKTHQPPRTRSAPLRLFTSHPASVGESYGQHLASAVRIAGELCVIAGLALAHGLFPFALQRSASSRLHALHTRITARTRHPEISDGT